MEADKEYIISMNSDLVQLLTELDDLYSISNNFEKAKIIKFLFDNPRLTVDNKIIPIYRHPFGILSKINLTLNDDDNDSGNKNNIGVKTDVISYDFLLEKPVFALNRSHNFIEGIRVGNLYDQLSKSSLSLPHIKKVKKYQELKKKKEKQA